MSAPVYACYSCGCTDDNCRQCIERTGLPCYWEAPGLCSACSPRRYRVEPGPGAGPYAVLDTARHKLGSYAPACLCPDIEAARTICAALNDKEERS